MGKPDRVHAWSPRTEYIGAVEPTRGTETSQYPEERKSIETPSVAASERGIAQTGGKQFLPGLWDSNMRLGWVGEWSGKAGYRG